MANTIHIEVSPDPQLNHMKHILGANSRYFVPRGLVLNVPRSRETGCISMNTEPLVVGGRLMVLRHYDGSIGQVPTPVKF